MPRRLAAGACVLCLALFAAPSARPQPREAAPADAVRQRIDALEESLHFAEESLTRLADEQTLFRRLDDLAAVDKIRYTGPPPRVVKNPTAQGAGNPVVVSAYTFLP